MMMGPTWKLKKTCKKVMVIKIKEMKNEYRKISIIIQNTK